jgi:hypothetical protein
LARRSVTHPAQAGCAPSLSRLAFTRSFREAVADLGVSQRKMDSPFYPYATLENDGFQLAVIEQGDTTHTLAAPLISDKERFSAKPGDIVKLIFEYQEVDEGQDRPKIGAEHMWVEITDYGDGFIIGRLDSSPQYTQILKSGDAVAFHPKHIIAFWNNEG